MKTLKITLLTVLVCTFLTGRPLLAQSPQRDEETQRELSIMLQLMQSIQTSCSATEIEAVEANARYKLTPAQYQANIGKIIKGYCNAKKQGLPAMSMPLKTLIEYAD